MKKTELLKEIENCIDKYELTPTSFGINSIGEPNFVFMMRKGREPREKTINRILAYISSLSTPNDFYDLGSDDENSEQN